MSLEGSASSTNLKVLKGKIRSLSPYAIDPSLTVEGASADAKATGDALEKKVAYTDIVDNLTSDDAKAPLSAKQGKALKKSIDSLATDIETAQTSADNAQISADEAKGTADRALSIAEGVSADSENVLPKDGGTMAGVISMGGFKITNLGDPVEAGDAVSKKYVDGTKATTATATLLSAGWIGNSQAVEVEGVTENNTILVTPAPESYVAYGEAVVYCSEQGDGYLSFTCSDVPKANLMVNILIMN
jgi:hypothetical protein